MPKINKRISETFFKIVSSIETTEKTTSHLSLRAQQAYLSRDYFKVHEYSLRLRSISPKGESVGDFFRALTLSNLGEIDAADRIFEELTNSELTPLRAASLLALGIRELQHERYEASTKLVSKAGALARSAGICAPLTAINAQYAMAFICGINGSSEQSIKLLETVEPLMNSVAPLFPAVMGLHFNALAYEHFQLGQVEISR